MIHRSHFVASVNHVNPLDIYMIKRTGAIERTGSGIPINPDLLQA